MKCCNVQDSEHYPPEAFFMPSELHFSKFPASFEIITHDKAEAETA
jgi:hypothetical protein